MKNLIIFDLDGTLLNTIADLAQSTNHALSKLGFPIHKEESYNLMVGNGINKLFERALPEKERNEGNILCMRKEFIRFYDEHNTDLSKPYPGIPELLKTLNRQGKGIAIATNKYQTAAEKLINYYFPEISFISILGQRDGILPKPDPAIIYEIINIANVDKKEILYVGDSGVDMQTAINAEVTSCGVTWGFRSRNELDSYHPDYIINKAEEILELI